MPTRRMIVAIVAGVSAVLTVASASAVPLAANIQISILVGTGPITERPPMIANGGTANVPVLDFIAGFVVNNAGPDVATVKAQFELPTGLRWGADGPDPSEDCTEAVTTVCQAALGSSPTSATPPQESAWGWNVVADAPGSYTLKAQIVESSTSDPDAGRQLDDRYRGCHPTGATTATASTAGEGHRQRRQAVARQAEGRVAWSRPLYA